MTTIQIIKSYDKIIGVRVSGHAFYNEYGEDIVCSAISMISYTIANKLIDIDKKNTEVVIEEGLFELLNENDTIQNNLLFDTLIMGYQMIAEQYKDNIKIKEG